MPRRPKITPAYLRHAARDSAKVRIEGRDIYLGPYGSETSHKLYNAIVNEWQATGEIPAPSSIFPRIEQLASRFLKWADRYYRTDGRATSEPGCLRLALRPLVALYGKLPADEFSAPRLKAVRNKMIKRGLCRLSINHHISRIKRFFRWAAENELVAVDTYQKIAVVAGLRRGKYNVPEGEPIRPVSRELIDAVEPFISREVWAMIQLQLLTAMRPGEVVILRPVDVDRSGPVWLYRPESHKTSHLGLDRVIALGPKAQEALTPFLLRGATRYAFSPRSADKRRYAACRTHRRKPAEKAATDRRVGDRYTVVSYRRAIHQACGKAFPTPKGLTKKDVAIWRRAHRWSPNRLRHTAATRIRREFGLDAARAILGHTNVKTTEIYAELDRSIAENVVGQIG